MSDVDWKVGVRVRVNCSPNLFGRMRADGTVLFLHRQRTIDPETGKTIDEFFDVGVFSNLRDAVAEQQVKYPAGKRVQAQKGVVKFTDETWKAFLKTCGTDGTRKRYRSAWKLLKPNLNNKRVDHIGPDVVMAVMRRMERDGYTKGGVRYEYEHGSYATVQTALSAFYREMAPTAVNPVLTLPKGERKEHAGISPVRKEDLLTDEELQRLIACLDRKVPGQRDDLRSHVYATMVRLAPHLGLRISEMLALRWDQVDLEERTLDVEYQIREDYKADTPSTWFAPLKGDKDNGDGRARQIGIPRAAVEILREYRNWCLSHQMRQADGLLFPNSRRRPIAAETVNAAIARALDEAGIQKETTFHHFRHLCASRLFTHLHMSYGEIALRLGDTEYTIRKTYAKFLDKRSAIKRYDELEDAYLARLAS